MNALVEETEPPDVFRVIGPVDAVSGTLAAAVVGDDTTTDVLGTLLKLTVIGETKFVPVIVTGALNMPEAGEKPLIVGEAANALAAQSIAIAS